MVVRGKKIARKKGDKEIHNLLNLRQELEANDADAEIVKVTLATQKSLFPLWTLERIQKEAVDEPSTHWLEPSISFQLDNIVDSQLDFPITPRDFLFRCFEKIERAPLFENNTNQMHFSFYIKYGKPQFKTWSLPKIVLVKVYAPVPTENFINIKLKRFRGTSRVEDDSMLDGLLFMNPYDWISIFLILSKEEQKYEIAKMDVEIAYVLKKKRILHLEEESKDLNKMNLGKIRKDK
ncbi:unnamed protein product [Lactuca saligna]|uniref:Uncharacterized protein n=1 Tax=Lactuca saligna TaxID=75948 RepID=A0AA36DYN6_LACSI|nr:unnamed protein product [Lactuca saligna]